jgi:hypothetical protein
MRSHPLRRRLQPSEQDQYHDDCCVTCHDWDSAEAALKPVLQCVLRVKNRRIRRRTVELRGGLARGWVDLMLPENRQFKAHISGFPHVSSARPATVRSPVDGDFDLNPSYQAALKCDFWAPSPPQSGRIPNAPMDDTAWGHAPARAASAWPTGSTKSTADAKCRAA